MNVLFGSVEYFEQELQKVAAQNHLNTMTHEDISMIYSTLKYELLHDFVCAERIRVECIENLTQAFCRLSSSEICAVAK